ncbi:MAG: RNA-binding S4 domain-containing protein [Vampirovibrionales bacterium]|nr:RNA-binding S4 domain-containing protein [Vampirovibrionales bacterium]
MRLDKFLKVSRLIKRRTLANELCDKGHAQINGAMAKAGAEIRVGQRITLRMGARRLTVEVLQAPEKAVPAQLAETLYQVISDETL